MRLWHHNLKNETNKCWLLRSLITLPVNSTIFFLYYSHESPPRKFQTTCEWIWDSTCPTKELTKETRMEKFAEQHAPIVVLTIIFLVWSSSEWGNRITHTANIIATSLTSMEDQSDFQQHLTKQFKSHRCALDFDCGFLITAFKEAKEGRGCGVIMMRGQFLLTSEAAKTWYRI